ncbi:MAG: hypothetical protein IJA91_04400 [Clostridia bacterium]|nr:hypothetical protein [Clostridia bacterium]
MNFIKTQTKDILWHSAKALLCAVQLFLLDRVAVLGVDALLFELIEIQSMGYALLRLGVDIALFIALWWYYNHIDDYSFNRFCARAETASSAPKLLRDPGFVTGHILTVLGATPILARALVATLRFTSLRSAEITAISLAASAVFVTVASLLRIHRLNGIWDVQRNLRNKKEKKPSRVKYLVGRIIYAAIYFGSLAALVYCGIAIFLPIFGSLFSAMIQLVKIPLLIFLCVLAALEIIRYVRRIFERRKFLRRLEKLRDKGELSFEIHGHPYRSLFGYRNGFGLTITDRPHPDGKKKTETTYRVSVANCHRRRLTVILCENQIYQFMYSVNIRFMMNMRGGLGMMGMAGVHGVRTFTLPAASWFVSHSFDFPEGESERILLVDPAPHVLCLRGSRKGEFFPLDNASEVFGYTVYGKNSFVNMLERT